MKYRIGIVTGIKNDVEMVEHFITHHLTLGFAKIHLMDFNSTDGTKEILRQYENHPQVEVELSPYNHGLPILQQQLRLRAYRDPDIDYLFYLDPDEFLVVSPGWTVESILDVLPSKCYYINRYNIVLPQILKQGLSERILSNLHKFMYLTPILQMVAYPLQSPALEWRHWMMQPIPLKALHKKEPVQTSLGGHQVFGDRIRNSVLVSHMFIAHFPISTYSRMIQKLESYQSLIDENSNVFEGFIQRYYNLCYVYQQGMAQEMYDNMFFDKEMVKELIKIDCIKKASKLLQTTPRHIPLTPLPCYRSFSLSQKLAALPKIS